MNRNVLIYQIIAVVCLAAGILYTLLHSESLNNSIAAYDSPSSEILIIDPSSGKEHSMRIEPASAKAVVSGPTPAVRLPAASLLSKVSRTREEIPRITIDQAKAIHDSGRAVFIDTRGRPAYEQGRIKGSVSMPMNDMPELLPKLRPLFKGKLLVTYCDGSGCKISDSTAFNLLDNGFERLAIFYGGWESWKEAGLPVETGRP